MRSTGLNKRYPNRPAMSVRLTLAMLPAALAVSACGGGTTDDAGNAPGAISEGEARALEEAASMLDEKRLPEGALPEVDPAGSADAEAPEAEAE